jgi:hypothetical protein
MTLGPAPLVVRAPCAYLVTQAPSVNIQDPSDVPGALFMVVHATGPEDAIRQFVAATIVACVNPHEYSEPQATVFVVGGLYRV